MTFSALRQRLQSSHYSNRNSLFGPFLAPEQGSSGWPVRDTSNTSSQGRSNKAKTAEITSIASTTDIHPSEEISNAFAEPRGLKALSDNSPLFSNAQEDIYSSGPAQLDKGKGRAYPDVIDLTNPDHGIRGGDEDAFAQRMLESHFTKLATRGYTKNSYGRFSLRAKAAERERQRAMITEYGVDGLFQGMTREELMNMKYGLDWTDAEEPGTMHFRVPLPGEMEARLKRREGRSTEESETPVTEIRIGDDETLDSILGALCY